MCIPLITHLNSSTHHNTTPTQRCGRRRGGGGGGEEGRRGSNGCWEGEDVFAWHRKEQQVAKEVLKTYRIAGIFGGVKFS